MTDQVRKHAETVEDCAATVTVVHDLGALDVSVSCYHVEDDGTLRHTWPASLTVEDKDGVTLRFVKPPKRLRVVVLA